MHEALIGSVVSSQLEFFVSLYSVIESVVSAVLVSRVFFCQCSVLLAAVSFDFFVLFFIPDPACLVMSSQFSSDRVFRQSSSQLLVVRCISQSV